MYVLVTDGASAPCTVHAVRYNRNVSQQDFTADIRLCRTILSIRSILND